MVVPESGPAFFGAGLAAMALLLIAVDAAHRTDSLARVAAEALHGEQQQDLLTDRVGELDAAVIVKSNFGVVAGETDFGLIRCVFRRLINEIERGCDGNFKAFQTTVTGAFDFARQLATKADLGGRFAIFGLARNVHGLWLKQFARPEIECPRREVEVELDFAKL